jgi:hypothetical protein
VRLDVWNMEEGGRPVGGGELRGGRGQAAGQRVGPVQTPPRARLSQETDGATYCYIVIFNAPPPQRFIA